SPRLASYSSLLSLFSHYLVAVLMIPPPPCSPLFPYTTLFRSRPAPVVVARGFPRGDGRARHRRRDPLALVPRRLLRRPRARGSRSEEHTSELQSLTNLVCRLLLEKKKNQLRSDTVRHATTTAH